MWGKPPTGVFRNIVLSLFPSSLDRAGSQFYIWTTFLIALAPATLGLTRMLELCQACPPTTASNSLEPYRCDASVMAKAARVARVAGPPVTAVSGATLEGVRAAPLPLPWEQRPTGGQLVGPTFISSPRTSEVGPPHPSGPAYSKGHFPQVLLSPEFKTPCRAAVLGCWTSPRRPAPVKPTGHHQQV